MRPRAVALFAATLVLSLLAFPAVGEERGLVLRTVDGDTLVVRIDGRAEKVRLIGVNAPESVDPRRPVQYFGEEASAFTRRLTDGKRVVLEGDPGHEDRDQYGRLLRYVFLEDGTLLNAEIIRQGYGQVYGRFPFSRMKQFRAYERQARQKRLGLWAAGPRTEPALSVPPAGAATSEKAGPRETAVPPGALYVGSAHGNRYHRPECEWARKIAPENLLPFRSAEEARQAGYLPCAVCRPPLRSPAPRP
ncbi:MAG TPA: thermonuclease family protein [Candidatus Polarisedimenticolia bacterium]|nr:thermonuclease family protein [Candidatus Polarisedimenticolia bacterium]